MKAEKSSENLCWESNILKVNEKTFQNRHYLLENHVEFGISPNFLPNFLLSKWSQDHDHTKFFQNDFYSIQCHLNRMIWPCQSDVSTLRCLKGELSPRLSKLDSMQKSWNCSLAAETQLVIIIHLVPLTVTRKERIQLIFSSWFRNGSTMRDLGRWKGRWFGFTWKQSINYIARIFNSWFTWPFSL